MRGKENIMIYPAWLKAGDTIGITAPSEGITAKKTEGFELSCDNLRKAGFQVKETKSVRSGKIASADPRVRASEWSELAKDEKVSLILCATGGDFLYDMLPYTDLSLLREHPKWVQGYSDPTGLLFGITTKYDVATIYGVNAGGFDMYELHPALQENIALWKGELASQKNFDLYEAKRSDNGFNGYVLSDAVKWETPNGAVDVTGRLIGGCMESLLDLIGTPFEAAADFAKRYREDGLIWYFDIFSLPAESVYRALLHLKAAGWFEGAKGFLFGRVLFPGTFVDMTYEEAVVGALGKEIPVVMEADVGHVNPKMTFVNGCIAHLQAEDGKGKIEYRFE